MWSPVQIWRNVPLNVIASGGHAITHGWGRMMKVCVCVCVCIHSEWERRGGGLMGLYGDIYDVMMPGEHQEQKLRPVSSFTLSDAEWNSDASR